MSAIVPIEHCLILAFLLFFIGAAGVLIRRNLITVLMSIELMLNSANLLFVAGSRQGGNVDGQVMMSFVVVIAACEAAIGLAMVIAIFRRYGNIKTEFLRALRG